jgi:hypothetical protein
MLKFKTKTLSLFSSFEKWSSQENNKREKKEKRDLSKKKHTHTHEGGKGRSYVRQVLNDGWLGSCCLEL